MWNVTSPAPVIVAAHGIVREPATRENVISEISEAAPDGSVNVAFHVSVCPPLISISFIAVAYHTNGLNATISPPVNVSSVRAMLTASIASRPVDMTASATGAPEPTAAGVGWS